MYKYYNANALNKNVADCTIRAISCATNKSWDYVYDYMSDIARLNGTMMDDRDFIIEYLDSKYKRVPVFGSVGETAGYYKNNIVLITTLGHILCSKFGIIYDTFDPRKRAAEYCWLVE